MFDTPHAETHAIMPPYAVSYLQPAVPEAARRLARAMDTSEHALARNIWELGRSVGTPAGLRSVGIREDQIPLLTQAALAKRLPSPRPPCALRQLEYFLAVAEELSFTRAAARLHIAQPPLSTQIRNLEMELDVALFDRSRRAIKLTAAGLALVPEARRILSDIERAARIVYNAGDGTVGRLALGFVPAAANGALPEILGRYRRRFPGVELTLEEGPPDALIHRLHERRIDGALLIRPFHDDALDSTCVNKPACHAGMRRAGPALLAALLPSQGWSVDVPS